MVLLPLLKGFSDICRCRHTGEWSDAKFRIETIEHGDRRRASNGDDASDFEGWFTKGNENQSNAPEESEDRVAGQVNDTVGDDRSRDLTGIPI